MLYVNSNTDVKVLRVGGNYNSNDNYGFFYFNANNNASNTNANIGSRHLVLRGIKKRARRIPYHLVKISPSGRELVGFSRKFPRRTRKREMPKRIGHLYETMADKDEIRAAIIDGTVGKRKRADVKVVLQDVDGYVEKAYEMIVNRAYVPSTPRSKRIYDKSCQKERIIQIVPFYPDGLMHQLCVRAMKKVLMRGMYRWSCASIPGRGNKCAADYVKRNLRNNPKGTKYCLKMDIKSYYPSMDRDPLMKALARKIKDRDFLKVVKDIIWSNGDGGLAIGYYINQWLANFFLEPLDWLICSLPGVTAYVRNMDDMVVLGPNKRRLHKARAQIESFLKNNLGLVLKRNWQIFPVDSRGIDFVGFRFYHTHTSLRRRNFLRFTRQCRKILRMISSGRNPTFHSAAGLLSRAGQLNHFDGQNAKEKYYHPIGEARLKKIVREHSHKLCT